MEQDELLFVWNDPEGNPPPPEVDDSRHALDRRRMDGWQWKSLVIDTNCREIVDNVVDMAHFFYVHYTVPHVLQERLRGPRRNPGAEGRRRDDVTEWTDPDVPRLVGNTSVAAYHGPSFMIDDLIYHYDKYDVESVLINCHYPIAPDKFVLMYGISVKKTEQVPAEIADQLVDAMIGYIGVGFEQDIEIWKNKTRIENPLLTNEDGPVYQLRRWYEQFYVDVAEVTADMVDRFEFELDTTRPVEAWKREVADNLARRAAAEQV